MRDDHELVVSAAGLRALVPDVLAGLIEDLQRLGLQTRQALLHQLGDGHSGFFSSM
ncbi:hypothetical protein D3C83_244910 [compost metagenome]